MPVPTEISPVAAVCQSIIPPDAVAPRVTGPEPHTDPGVVPVITGTVFTVATTAVLEAVVQEPTVAST